MALTVHPGDPVTLVITGHSATNGATIPAGSTVAITATDPSVATAADIPPLAADMGEVTTPVTVLSTGSTDFSVSVTAPDGSVFTAADSLVVELAAPTLASISVSLRAG